MLPFISVVITLYNIEEYLEQCVDSVCEQTLSNLEIILVDDGSSDRSPQICDRLSCRDERIKVIHKAHGGVMSAWMAGVTESRAPYIIFVDGDDWIEQDMCEVLYRNTELQRADICCCGFVRHHGDDVQKFGTHETKAYETDEIKNRLVPELLTYFLKGNPDVTITRWAKIFRRGIIVDSMGLCNQDIHIGEEINIVFPAFLRSQKIYVMGNCHMYHYRIRNNSLMTSNFNDRNIDRIRILNDEMCKLSGIMNYKDSRAVNLFCSFLYYELFRKVYLSNSTLWSKISTIKMIKKTLPQNISFDELYRAFAGSQNFTKNKKIVLRLLSSNHTVVPAIFAHVFAGRRL